MRKLLALSSLALVALTLTTAGCAKKVEETSTPTEQTTTTTTTTTETTPAPTDTMGGAADTTSHM